MEHRVSDILCTNAARWKIHNSEEEKENPWLPNFAASLPRRGSLQGEGLASQGRLPKRCRDLFLCFFSSVMDFFFFVLFKLIFQSDLKPVLCDLMRAQTLELGLKFLSEAVSRVCFSAWAPPPRFYTNPLCIICLWTRELRSRKSSSQVPQPRGAGRGSVRPDLDSVLRVQKVQELELNRC